MFDYLFNRHYGAFWKYYLNSARSRYSRFLLKFLPNNRFVFLREYFFNYYNRDISHVSSHVGSYTTDKRDSSLLHFSVDYFLVFEDNENIERVVKEFDEFSLQIFPDLKNGGFKLKFLRMPNQWSYETEEISFLHECSSAEGRKFSAEKMVQKVEVFRTDVRLMRSAKTMEMESLYGDR